MHCVFDAMHFAQENMIIPQGALNVIYIHVHAFTVIVFA